MKVLAILCRSYGGSTITNMLLNSHPKVYGGSELSRFHNRFDSAVCSAHGKHCDVWTAETRMVMANTQAANFYHILSDITRYTLFVDASKTLRWFNADFLKDAVQHEVEFYFIYLLKHPMAHATSFLMNRMCKKYSANRKFSEAKSLLSIRHDEALSFVCDSLPSLLKYIEKIRSEKHYIRKYGSVDEVKLEEIISNPDIIFALAAEFFDIEESDFSVNYDSAEFTHPIGGNRGALAKVALSRKSDNERITRYRRRGLVQDDKWRLVLPKRLIEEIQELPIYLELCDRMGYALRPSEFSSDDVVGYSSDATEKAGGQ